MTSSEQDRIEAEEAIWDRAFAAGYKAAPTSTVEQRLDRIEEQMEDILYGINCLLKDQKPPE